MVQSNIATTTVGICSWAEKTLVDCRCFYPAQAKTPEARLRYYAQQFPLVEIDSTYYALPREQQSASWAERTPEGFVFNAKAFRLLTQHPAEPKVLPKDLREDLPAELASKRRLYLKDLPERHQAQVWRRFRQGLEPLHKAGKLGAVLFQFPPWFFPSDDSREHILRAAEALAGLQLAIEFRHDSWLNDKNRDRTLQFLQDYRLTYVCVDEPQDVKGTMPPLLAVTNPDFAMLRFHGRDPVAWKTTADSAAERFRYLYSADEVQELADRTVTVSRQASTTHALFNNCHEDKAVRNARELAQRLAALA